MRETTLFALNEKTQQVVATLRASGYLPLSALGVRGARETSEQLSTQAAASAPIVVHGERDVAIGGEFPSSALLISPSRSARGLIVYFHGGGWVIGSPVHYRGFAQRLAEATQCAVLLPRYRLAPEHPFPAAALDAIHAVRWAAGNIVSLAGDTVPLIVSGDSAGANLAAVAAQQLYSELSIAAQVLVYPVTNADFTTSSYVDRAEHGMLWTRDMRWFWDQYVPDVHQRENPMASPLRASSVAGLPPTIIVAAEVDPLLSEGRAYADKLQAAGVPVTYHLAVGSTHGYINMIGVLEEADQALQVIATALQSHL